MAASVHSQAVPEGPHRAIVAADDSERFALDLFDTLWDRYRQRVGYVRTYEQMVREAGGAFVNDHIAFRTFAGQQPLTGIASISRVFEALGYRAAGCYQFPDKHLSAIHFQHPNVDFPKLFISELQTWRVAPELRSIIERTVARHRPAFLLDSLVAMSDPSRLSADDRGQLLEQVVREFHELPWPPPEKEDVERANRASQYAAWVLVHGYNVNHFTAYINSQGVESLADIEKTIAALKTAGVPMKAEIEGERGSKLRQTATEAVVIDVPVREQGAETTMPWSYAYFELAERGEVVDPETGRRVRFDGFLGPQATNLFEMTRR